LGLAPAVKYSPVHEATWGEQASKATRLPALAGDPARWSSRRIGHSGVGIPIASGLIDCVICVQDSPGCMAFAVTRSAASRCASAKVKSRFSSFVCA